MSLQGSLETFALPDVLVLLASTKKDGELHVTGASREGHIWVEKGQIVHARFDDREVGSVEAVFELLRLEEGAFSFEGDKTPPSRHDPETIDLVLADAQERLGEWREVAKVVPHVGVLVDMAREAPGDEVVITGSQWRMLRAVAGGASVARLMEIEHLSEFDGCRAVKELFESNLVSLDLTAPKPGFERRKSDAKAGAASSPAATIKADGKRNEPFRSEPDRRADRGDRGQGDRGRGDDVPSAADDVASSDAALEITPVPASDESGDDRRSTRAAATPATAKADSARADLDSQIAALVDEASGSIRRVRPSTTGDPAGAPKDAAQPEPVAAAKAPEDAKAFVAKLAALEGENEEKLAKKVEEHLAAGGELPEVGEGDEPINRGLLLKFLSSVRN